MPKRDWLKKRHFYALEKMKFTFEIGLFGVAAGLLPKSKKGDLLSFLI
ncbi:hypothetical protein [Lactobacillus nasalidis]|nr:hypothetical protein [Lactobacillus nasalidis]